MLVIDMASNTNTKIKRLKYKYKSNTILFNIQLVNWLKRHACGRHGLGPKSTRAILLCPLERHFAALSPSWWPWQAVLNSNHISIKLKKNNNFQLHNNILASSEAGRGNYLPHV